MRPRIARLHRRGSAYILALLFLAIFVAMAAAFAATTNTNARSGKNLLDVHRAQWAAESGLNYAIQVIRSITMPSATTEETAIANIAASLSEKLANTPNLNGGCIAQDGTTVTLPAISLGSETFQISVVRTATGQLILKSRGVSGGIGRTVAMDLSLTDSWSKSAFSYGIASYGAISIAGNGEVRGMNELTEASVISATSGSVAITVDGNCVVDGDLSSTGSNTSVVLSGNPTIAGSQDPAVIAEHIHFGVKPPVFPEVDTSAFKSMANGDVIDANTNTGSPGLVFENVLIKAGTNPTFSSDVVLNGIVYIEAPNIVNFSAKVTLNGMVATDMTDEPIESCKLSFQGQVEAYGVEALSDDEPQFADIKQMTGTFIVAPGFDVSFAGQFTTINGTVAADKLSFSGQASGTVEGSVIGLDDTSMYVGGTVDIVIDRSGEQCPPPGFTLPLSLSVNPRTYRELVEPGA